MSDDDSLFEGKTNSGDCFRFRNPTIVDVLSVTFFVAVCTAFFTNNFGERLAESGSNLLSTLHVGWFIVEATICGIFLAALFWFRETKKNSGRFFHHPGYWALFISGLYSLSALCGAFWMFAVGHEIGDVRIWLAAAIVIITGMVGWTLNLFAVIRCNGIWRLGFGILALPSMLVTFALSRSASVGQISMFYFWFHIAIGALFFVASADDLYRRRIRDWLHWLGVAILMAKFLLVPTVDYFLSRLI